MDVESLKARLREIDWVKWLKIAGKIILILLVLALAFGFIALILGAFVLIFVGIPVGILILLANLLKEGYIFLSGLEIKYYYATAFVALLLFLLLLFRRIGLVSLSSQSLAHRRNLLFAFFLVFLIENFNLNVAKMFKAENELINEASRGLLAFFALYSFVEYVHNFLHDYLRAKNESKITQYNAFFRGPRLIDPWLIFIGNFRFLFDVVLPIATSAFILMIYSKDIRTVYDIGQTYVTQQVSIFVNEPENVELRSHLGAAAEEYGVATSHLSEVFHEAKETASRAYENVKEAFDKSADHDETQ